MEELSLMVTDIHNGQEKFLMGGIYGKGKYELAPWAKPRFYIKKSVWVDDMDDDQRIAHARKLWSASFKEKDVVVDSEGMWPVLGKGGRKVASKPCTKTSKGFTTTLPRDKPRKVSAADQLKDFEDELSQEDFQDGMQHNTCSNEEPGAHFMAPGIFIDEDDVKVTLTEGQEPCVFDTFLKDGVDERLDSAEFKTEKLYSEVCDSNLKDGRSSKRKLGGKPWMSPFPPKPSKKRRLSPILEEKESDLVDDDLVS